MKNPFKQAAKKCITGILAVALASGTVLSGAVGIQAAARDQALVLPIDFIGISDRLGAQDQSSARYHFNGGAHVDLLADSYTYSYTWYIPQAVFASAGSTVSLDCWFDVQVAAQAEGEEDLWLGTLGPRYDIALINEKGQVRPGVWDTEHDWELVEDPAVYETFLSLDTAGDFYKVTIKDAPVSSVLHREDDVESSIDTSINGYLNINVNLVGTYNQISSIAYLDDVCLKAGGNTVIETDGSQESLNELAYYDYVLAAKDETCVERPASTDLNTSLLALEKTSGKVKVGKTLSIKASAAASGTIAYTSSNKKVATVSADGKVKGVKAGTANIAVSANGVTKTFKVTVKK